MTLLKSESSPKIIKGIPWWILLAGLPLLIPLALNLWAREPYQFFPMAWFAAGWLWLRRLGQTGSSSPSPTLFLATFSLGWVLLTFAVLIWSPWLGGASFVLLLASWSFYQQSFAAWRQTIPVLLLLLLTLPPPLQIDEKVLLKLKELAVALSSRYLDLQGLVHVRSGAVIELPRETLLVEEACSGINSFLSVMAAALFIVVFERRTWWHSIFVLAYTVIIVIAVNVARICAGALLKVNHGIDILNGPAHQWTGLAVFVLAVGCVWSFDRFMTFFSTRETVVYSSAAGKSFLPPDAPDLTVPVSVPRSFKTLPRLCLILMLVTALAGASMGALRLTKTSPGISQDTLTASDGVQKTDFALPAEIEGWKQMLAAPVEKNAEVTGIYSSLWSYERDGVIVSIAIDYPFVDYHDVSVCYINSAWTLESTDYAGEFSVSKNPATRYKFVKAALNRSEVLSSNFTALQQWIDPVKEKEGEQTRSKFWNRFKAPPPVVKGPPQYRVQAMWSGLAPLLPNDRRAMDLLFDKVRVSLASQVAAHLPLKP